MKKIAIYPGTFDPITHGHIDLIHRATHLFDKVVIAVASSAGKSPLFSLDKRVEIVEKVFLDQASIPIGFQGDGKARAKSSRGAYMQYVSSETSAQHSQNLKGDGDIEVISFSNLLVDVMEEKNISIVIRGIRSNLDLEHEFQLSEMNAKMKPNMETVFLKANPAFANMSSTIVREIARMTTEGSLGNLSLFVPEVVIEALNVTKDH